MREKSCEHWARCGRTGHYYENGLVRRCPCLVQEINKRKLGVMFDPRPVLDTNLIKKRNQDLRIEGSLSQIRPHIAGALIKQSEENRSFRVLDAYRLIEIFLEKDEEIATQTILVEADLLILLLGFGDPRTGTYQSSLCSFSPGEN